MILQSKDPKSGFKLGNVKLKVSKEKLVSNVGLGTIMQIFDESPLPSIKEMERFDKKNKELPER